MKAIKFKDANINVAESQDEYNTLPALKLNDDCDTTITCYSLTIWERIKVLFQGHIWMSEMNFNRPMTPRYFSVCRKEVYSKTTD